MEKNKLKILKERNYDIGRREIGDTKKVMTWRWADKFVTISSNATRQNVFRSFSVHVSFHKRLNKFCWLSFKVLCLVMTIFGFLYANRMEPKKMLQVVPNYSLFRSCWKLCNAWILSKKFCQTFLFNLNRII